MSDSPPARRIRPPAVLPPPEEVRFAPVLTAPPLDMPRRQKAPDAVTLRRRKAEHLCLWLSCRRALCRSSRRCLGRSANCVFETEEPGRPLLDEVVAARP